MDAVERMNHQPRRRLVWDWPDEAFQIEMQNPQIKKVFLRQELGPRVCLSGKQLCGNPLYLAPLFGVHHRLANSFG